MFVYSKYCIRTRKMTFQKTVKIERSAFFKASL